MTRMMYDSTDPSNIPAGVQIVAYYPHAWGSDMTKHHDALQVRIDNRGDHADDCHVLDVESGAASNTIAAEWVRSWNKLHPEGMHAANGFVRKPVLYTSVSNLPALRTACDGLTFDTWAAHWDGNTTPVPGCFAKQYADPKTSGGDYDLTMVYDDTWGKETPAPTPAPVPVPAPPAVILGAVVTWNGVQFDAARVASHDGGKTWSL